ncbi:MAG: VWA domain-containing protein [Nocardioides sp.]|nr:VWA domain-containing protein [Nocardioides sp.]
MAGWMKRTYDAEGVTEYPAGPLLAQVTKGFSSSGAIVLCIDVSYSMKGRNLDEAKKGGRGFLDDAVAGGYQAGLVLWSSKVDVAVSPSPDGHAARRALERASVSGMTNLAPALKSAGEMLAATGADDQVCVVFTDGVLTDADEAIRRAEQVKAAGVRVLTIGLGGIAAQGLDDIASEQEPPTRETTTASLAADMRQIASGLSLRRKP